MAVNTGLNLEISFWVPSALTQEVALLSQGGASGGSVAGNVLERAGPPTVVGPQVVLGGCWRRRVVAVGAVGLLKVLQVCVWVVRMICGLWEARTVTTGGWRGLVTVAGGDTALVERPTRTSGFVLGRARDGGGRAIERKRERERARELAILGSAFVPVVIVVTAFTNEDSCVGNLY